jgi:hypothetical protein
LAHRDRLRLIAAPLTDCVSSQRVWHQFLEPRCSLLFFALSTAARAIENGAAIVLAYLLSQHRRHHRGSRLTCAAATQDSRDVAEGKAMAKGKQGSVIVDFVWAVFMVGWFVGRRRFRMY